MQIHTTMNVEANAIEELPALNAELRVWRLGEPVTRVPWVRHVPRVRHVASQRPARRGLTFGMVGFRQMLARGLLGNAELRGALAVRLGGNRCLFSLKCGRG